MDRVARSADDQLLMYTGGTTGLPKGVVWPHRTMIRPISVTAYGVRGLVPPRDVREVVELARELAGSPDQPVTLAACPFIHAHALFTSFGTLQSGGTVVIAGAEGFDADEMWRTVEGRRVTDVLIVGDAFSRRMVDALAEADRRGDAPDLSSLRYVISAGVGWSPDAKQAMLSRCDARLVDMLAASEGGPFAIDIISPADGGRPPRFRAGPSTKLFTAGGEEIAAGSEEAGFLGVSDAIPLGYFKDEAKTAQTFRTIGGIRYAIPGDLARIEPDGTLILLGREAAVINTGGEKVFAEEVERVILSHPAIADCNVVGVPDERWGQAVAAVVALRPGQELAERDVIDHVGGRLANYKRPKRVAFVPAVERGPAGKSDLQWARRVLAEAP
jgi:fatty-acyl-CoA synthase